MNIRFLERKVQANAVTVRVDDTGGWASLGSSNHDYDLSQIQENYQDALTAWRKNPLAWRIIAITTDFVIGDNLRISSENRTLDKFITAFWNHPKNHMDLRLEGLVDELCRSGDLFILLFRNEQDGMSYIRFVTKDQVVSIETAQNDWETELSYTVRLPGALKPGKISPSASGAPAGAGPAPAGLSGLDEQVFVSPEHPQAATSPAVMLHYSINRVMGALMGEGDLQPIIPWLQRYSRMLEDRVRLHWAMRAFLWFVTVPTNKVLGKQEQYRTPPEAGSIVVKDDQEKWEVVNPSLHGIDASQDLKSVRMMIDAGSGQPPHWRGDASMSNLATARAMQAPTERHLLRRQQFVIFMLQDILFKAYQRGVDIGRFRRLSSSDYSRLFTVNMPDISRDDNSSLAKSAQQVAAALSTLATQLGGKSKTFNKILLRTVFKFAGEPLQDEILDEILQEMNATQQDDKPEAKPDAKKEAKE